jgi:hypothetical protein
VPLQVYNVTSSKKQPQWVSDKKKKSLRKDEDYRWEGSQRLQQATLPPLRSVHPSKLVCEATETLATASGRPAGGGSSWCRIWSSQQPASG